MWAKLDMRILQRLALKTATILELVSRVEVEKLVEPRKLLCK